jgi:hypothetical protein
MLFTRWILAALGRLCCLGLFAFVPGWGGPVPGGPNGSSAIVGSIDVGKVWSVHHTARPQLLTHGENQYVTYFDADRILTIAHRKLDSADWHYHQFPVQAGWATGGHAKISIGIDEDGYLHLSCYRRDLVKAPKPPPMALYYRSKAPHSIEAFEHTYMISPNEHPHYPTYYEIGNTLYFSFRDGLSGRGNQMLNRYDAERRTWYREFERPLTDGQGERNAYHHNSGIPYPGPDGRFHLYWVWRETFDHATNNSLSYARTVGSDLSEWEAVDGSSVTPPFTIENRELLIDDSPPGGGLSNILFKLGWDSRDRAVVSYHKFDSAGHSQIYVGRVKNGQWHIVQVTDWDYVWGKNYSGGGALAIGDHIRLGSIQVGDKGELTQYVWNADDGGSLVILDEASLEPIRVEAPPSPPKWKQKLRKPESDFQVEAIPELRRAGGPMRVSLIADKGETEETGFDYYLRWEHAGTNRDRAIPKPWPEPSMLKVYKVRSRE